jgi:hypothetical protein
MTKLIPTLKTGLNSFIINILENNNSIKFKHLIVGKKILSMTKLIPTLKTGLNSFIINILENNNSLKFKTFNCREENFIVENLFSPSNNSVNTTSSLQNKIPLLLLHNQSRDPIVAKIQTKRNENNSSFQESFKNALVNVNLALKPEKGMDFAKLFVNGNEEEKELTIEKKKKSNNKRKFLFK